MTPVSRATAAGRAYLDLKAKATAESRLTGELIQLYVLEGFLARLAVSDHAEQLSSRTSTSPPATCTTTRGTSLVSSGRSSP